MSVSESEANKPETEHPEVEGQVVLEVEKQVDDAGIKVNLSSDFQAKFEFDPERSGVILGTFGIFGDDGLTAYYAKIPQAKKALNEHGLRFIDQSRFAEQLHKDLGQEPSGEIVIIKGSGRDSQNLSVKVIWRGDALHLISLEYEDLRRKFGDLPTEFREMFAKVGEAFGRDWEKGIPPSIWEETQRQYTSHVQAREQKIAEEARMRGEAKSAAENIYDSYRAILAESGRLANFRLDTSIFPNTDDIEAQSRENAIRALSHQIRFHPELDLASEEFKRFLKRYLSRADIGHNFRQETLDSLRQGQALKKMVRPDANIAFGISEGVPALPSVIIDPESVQAAKLGTGYAGDFTAFFDLEKYAPRSLVGIGDIDHPDSFRSWDSSEQNWKANTMVVPDALLHAAINNWQWQKQADLGHVVGMHYDEVMLFGEVNILLDAKRIIEIKTGQPISANRS